MKNKQSSVRSNGPVNEVKGAPPTYSEEATPLVNEFLERYISFKPILALGLTLQCSWEAIAVIFQATFVNGGPAALVYGIILVTLGSMAIASTLGEMAAVDPTVGAQYRWAIRYAPKSLRPQMWGFIQGWLTVFAWIASCTSTPFILATVVQTLVEFNSATYVPKRWHTTLLAWAFIVLSVVCNLFARRLLVVLETIAGLLHVGFFFGIVITLGVLVPRNSNDFVWDTVISGVSGWTSPGAAFCIGLLSPAAAVIGFDGIIHMSDETKQANAFIPRAMVFTVLINGLLAFGFIVCLLYTLGDPNVTLTQSTLPIITILYNATGSVAATNALMSLIVISLSAGNFSIFASVSRLTYAFARDGGLPFSKFFAYVDPTLQIPVNALFLIGIICGLICIINIGSTVAFFAIISLAVFSLFISYLPPIVFLLIRKLRGEALSTGPWSLGRFGIVINIFALCYAIFMVIWTPFPSYTPVTAETLNYAAPVWGGCMLFAVMDYVLFGHKRFHAEGEENVEIM